MLPYFAYSVAVFNAWVVANAILGYITGIHAEKESLISQQHFKNMTLSSCLFDCRMLPEPPTTDACLSTFARTSEIDFYSIWQDTIRWASTITK